MGRMAMENMDAPVSRKTRFVAGLGRR